MSPKLPELPLEVIGMIVGHMKDDKHSLAQWMRVSSHFNRVAAPLFYRYFTLEMPRITSYNMIAQPDGTPFYQSNLAAEGRIPSKEDNMQHTQMVTVRGRFNWSNKVTKDFFPRFSEIVDIPIMRIEIPRNYSTGEWGGGIPQTPPEEYPRSYPYLGIWQRVRPKKIVIVGNMHRYKGTQYKGDDIKRLPSGLECLVIHFDCEDAELFLQRYHAIRTCPTLRKLVFIISDAPYIHEVEPMTEDDLYGWWGIGYPPGRFSGLIAMRGDCEAAAKDVEYRGEIIIVNREGLGPEMTDFCLPNAIGNRIQYLSLSEYHNNHDTAGEFEVLQEGI